MATQYDHLNAADTDDLIGEKYPQLFRGMTAEGLTLIIGFEPHLVDLEGIPEAVAETMPGWQDLDENLQERFLTSVYQVLWESLPSVYRALFSGRELDSFSVAGTLQRSLEDHRETQFIQIAERLSETCIPVRMCEDTFDMQEVVQPTLSAWTAERVENGLDHETAYDEQYQSKAADFIQEVLNRANRTLVSEVKNCVIIPDEQ